MPINQSWYTSKTVEWATPQKLFDELNQIYHFDLDVCATPENAKCEQYFTKEQDGLSQDWYGTVFMNPPYGKEIIHWMEKAYLYGQAGGVAVCLIPARTDTRWWHDYAMKGHVKFIRGRLKYNDGKNPAPFPSAIVVFGDTKLWQQLKNASAYTASHTSGSES